MLFALIAPSYASDSTTLYLKAVRLEQEGNFDEAYKAYRQILVTDKTPTIYLKLADIDIMRQNIDSAYTTLQEARKAYPDNVEIAFRMGVYCTDRADSVDNDTVWLKEAKVAFQDAANKDETEQHLVALAMIVIRLKEYDQAFAIYDKLINELKLIEYYRHRGVLKIEIGKKKEGIADLKTAASNKDVQAMIRLADIEMKDNNTKAATKYLEEASKLQPDLILPDIYLGEIHKNTDDYEGAIRYYLQAAENMDGKMRGVLMKQAGGLALSKEDYATALDVYQRALKDDSSDPQIYYLAGHSATMLKKYDVAQNLFEVGLSKFPDYAMLRKRAAYNLLMLNRPKEAIEVISKVDAIERDLEYYLLLADAYSTADEHNKTLATLRAGLVEYPDSFELYMGLASEFESVKKYDDCIKALKEALRVDPNAASAQNFLGYLYADLNMNLKEAETLIDSALKQEPDNYAFIDSKGWLEFRKGNFKRAYELISKALEMVPEDKEILEHMKIVKEKMGNKQ
ncbi:MAG: tetratricopeptide repeat protein [Deferribacteraceae bacterium]|nr:tetratricopeptide repeat protein [Deferribacteraceae bacterium]